jgi:hypothetical protein
MQRGWIRQLTEGGPALRDMPVDEIIAAVDRVATRFLTDGDPLRRQALERIPEEAGFSPEMARHILDRMAVDWLEPPLRRMVDQEFPDPAVLDRWVESPDGSGRWLRAMGDGVALHIGAGSVPGVCATTLVRSLLVKTPVLVKPGRGDRALVELLFKGLQEDGPVLAGAAQVVYWSGGDRGLEDGILDSVDRVVVYGSNETVASVRERVRPTVPVVAYHHRSSVAVIGGAALTGRALDDTAEELAWSIATFDQRGCVSPHRVWVVGDRSHAAELAAATAEAMEMVEDRVPSGPRSDAEMARIHRVRDEVELRGAAGERVRVWRSEGTRWTVVLESSEGIRAAGTPRTIKIAPCASVERLASVLAPERSALQTVGTAGLHGVEARSLADALALMGATRIVPIRDMSFPPAWWHHDGMGPLRPLVRWAEWEEDVR